MKLKLKDNQMSVDNFELSAVGIIPSEVILREIRVSYVQDAKGNRTDTIESVRYNCLDLDTFSTFTIKVNSLKPVMSDEALQESDEPITIEIPINETIIRPYELKYGKVKVSIIAPYVKVVTQ